MATFNKITAFLALSVTGFDNEGQKWIAIAGDGFPRFVYFDSTGGELHYVQFHDKNGDSVTDSIVATDGGTGIYDVAMVIGSDGFARILFTSGGGTEVHLLICQSNDGLTSDEITLATGVDPDSLSLTLDADDNVYAIYIDLTGANRMRLARCDADGSNIQLSTIVSISSSGGSRIASALATDGFLRIAYFDTSPSKHVYYIKCSSADGTANTKTSISALITHSVFYIDMVLTSDDTARIIFQDGGGAGCTGLNYVKLTSSDGSTYDTAVLDGVRPDFISQVSIALSNTNLPRIAYGTINDPTYPSGIYNLNYLEFSADDVSSFTPTTVVSSDTEFGNFLSMVFGPDGEPYIIYPTSDLKTFFLARISVDVELPDPTLPSYTPSIISAVLHAQQGAAAPRFIMGGQNQSNQYALFKKATTYVFSLLRTAPKHVGIPFQVVGVHFSLPVAMATGMSIVPVLYFDGELDTSVCNALDPTNYTDGETRFDLTPDNFNGKVSGKNNFFLELQIKGSVLSPVNLPVTFDVIYEQTP